MSIRKVECLGCGCELTIDGADVKCPNCGTVASAAHIFTKDDLKRLSIAAGYRRVGRFDDAQQELENLLLTTPDLDEALFGCFLNAYEVTEYAFHKDNSIKICKCTSSSRRPVDKHSDWLENNEKRRVNSVQLSQWTALSKRIEEERQLNLKIKNSIPKYRAILTCDYNNANDFNVTYGLYRILSKQTDIFFAPITLRTVLPKYKNRYLCQAIKNPEIAPLMFVVYSDAFNYRNKANEYYDNIAGQCREFSKTHTKTELFSVTCDYEPSPIMKRISVKTIRCKDFADASYANIAAAILDNITASTYDDEEYTQYLEGKAVPLNERLGLSPLIFNPVI